MNTSPTCLDVALAYGLKTAKVRGAEHGFLCPNHEDRNPSLKINTIKNGWICGPCNQSGNYWALAAFLSGNDPNNKPPITEFLRGLGLFSGNGDGKNQAPPRKTAAAPRAAPPKAAKEPPAPTPPPETPKDFDPDNLPPNYYGKKILRFYSYAPGLEITRIAEEGIDPATGKPNKTFRPWAFGHWVEEKHPLPAGVQWPLYHAANMKDATRILIVEGEQCVETAETADLVATTPAGCAKGHDHYIRYAESIPETVKEIWISCDNDTAGKAQGDAWLKALKDHSRVEKIRISYALPDVGTKGDISDFAKIHGAEWPLKFFEHIGGIAPWTRPPAPPEKIPPHLQILKLADVPEEDEPIKYFIEGLIPEDALVFGYGEPERKKTWLLLHAALHVAAGRRWLGHDVNQTNVLWIDEESGRKRINHRLRLLRRGEDFANEIPFGYTVFAGFNFGGNESFQWLRETIDKHQAKLVFIDTLASTTSGVSENDSDTMGQIAIELRRVCEEKSCAMVVIHHCGKDPGKGMRGTSALTGKADRIIKIDSKPGDGIIRVDIQKDRDGAAKSFTSEFFFLPNVGDGKPGIRIITAEPVKKEMKFSRREMFVISYLKKENGRAITITELQENADTCSPKSIPDAVYGLVEKGIVKKETMGGGGRGDKTTFKLRETD